MGDLFRALGQGEEARQAYLKALGSASAGARPSPTAPTTSATSRFPTAAWATSSAPSVRARRHDKLLLESLGISERLAQAEPDRADYQRDVIISCVKIAENVPEEARPHLSRALDIALHLRSQGRLDPVDVWMPDDLARRLGELSG